MCESTLCWGYVESIWWREADDTPFLKGKNSTTVRVLHVVEIHVVSLLLHALIYDYTTTARCLFLLVESCAAQHRAGVQL